MTNQRSPLDSLNMRRERRPLASIEELNHTLSALESQLQQPYQAQVAQRPYQAEGSLPDAAPSPSSDEPHFLRHSAASQQPVADHPHREALAEIAEQLQRLRLRSQLQQNIAAADATETETGQAHAISATERFIAGSSRQALNAANTAPIGAASQHDPVLRRDFDELKRTVETLAREESLRRMSHRWDALDERFDNFEQTQTEKLRFNQAIDPALADISTRLAELRHAIEQLPDNQSHALLQLDERLDEISRAILATGYQASQSEQEQAVLTELDRRFSDLTRHLDAHYQQSVQKSALHDDRFIQALEDRLDTLSRQVQEHSTVAPATDQHLLYNLEKQLGLITEHLNKPDPVLPELTGLKPRLDKIEQVIDSQHDLVMDAAKQAAEAAIQQLVGKTDPRDSSFAHQLADDLKALEQFARDSDARNSQTFNKVQDTLLKIADRLAQIEKDSLAKPRFGAGRVQAGPMQSGRVQDRSAQFSNQFPAADWNEPYDADVNPFSQLRSPSKHAASYAGVPSPAAAAIDAARAAIKASTQAESQPDPHRPRQSAAAQPAAPQSAMLETSDLMLLEPEQSPDLTPDSIIEPALTSMPDLNAIIRRVRDEQRGTSAFKNYGSHQQPESGKADLIHAARRAIQAAADETGRLRRQDDHIQDNALTADISAGETRDTAKPKRSLRKPLLLAIGAVIIAATGLQLGQHWMSEKPAAETVALQEQPATGITAPNAEPAALPAPQPSVAYSAANSAKDYPLLASTAAELPAPDMTTTHSIAADAAEAGDTTSATAAIETPAQDETQAHKTQTSELSAILPVPQAIMPAALREAAASGDVKALYEIGMRYIDGHGVPSDYAEAAKWYRLAAERGFAPAQYRLGNLNEKGLGLPRNATKATALYQQAALQGNASAMHNLAVLYAMGADGAADNQQAAKWFFKAAELGVKDSQYNLGILAAKGSGMAQNYEESYKWFALAALAGDQDAAQKRDQIAQSLKPEQLERAVNLTKLWKPKPLDDAANTVDIPQQWQAPMQTGTAADNAGGSSANKLAEVDMAKAVRNIQLILHKNGFDSGTPDGIMGNKTRQAIADFQKANGMAASGEIDQQLVEALLAKNT